MNKCFCAISCAVALAAMMVACGNKDDVRQFDEVVERAETAAAKVVEADSAGLMELQDCILRAKAVQSEYVLLGDTVAADTFDACFRRYVTELNPQLAEEMF